MARRRFRDIVTLRESSLRLTLMNPMLDATSVTRRIIDARKKQEIINPGKKRCGRRAELRSAPPPRAPVTATAAGARIVQSPSRSLARVPYAASLRGLSRGLFFLFSFLLFPPVLSH